MQNIYPQFNNDIIVIGQQPWDTEIGSNCKNIALEFSKHHRVLYINSPLDRITLIKTNQDPKTQHRLNVIRKKQKGLVQIGDNFWNYYPDCMVESVNWIDNNFLFDMLNRFNNYKFARSVKKALKELKFTNYLLFNDSEMFKGFYLKEFLKPALSIYYSRDYMVAFDYWEKHGVKYEPLLIAKSDLCFANSAYLKNYCKTYNANSFDVGQGCDIEDFKNISNDDVPADLQLIKGPIIGYIGALNSLRLDKEIIAHIALSFPGYKVLLIGPEDNGFITSDLHQVENIIFLGQKPVDKLAAYIQGFDVCINPQAVNAVTVGNYPRKIDEYLALGKPVVATATETMEFFKDFVYLADNKERYIVEIKKALAEDDKDIVSARKDFAFSHTWENSVKLMYDRIADKLAVA